MTQSDGGAGQVRVLVVDDDDDTSYILSLYLEREGWRVNCAPSVREARAELAQNSYDVLVTDLNLPDGDGLSLLEPSRPERLRAALLVTGVSDSTGRRYSEDRGFDCLLVKPFDGKQIVSLIRRLLSRAEALPNPSAPLH
jgi:DNA-binding response OmpR family regulator